MRKTATFLLICLSLNSISCLAEEKTDTNAGIQYVENYDITIEFDYGKRTGTYSGALENNLPNGIGKFSSTSEDGIKWSYVGEWERGHFNGLGMTIWDNDQIQVGNYSQDYFTGNGLMALSNSSIYYGDFEHGNISGQGTLFTLSDRYIGEFRDGVYAGNGICYFENGNKFEGSFDNNCISGNGTYYYSSGEYVTGTFETDPTTNSISGDGTFYALDNTATPCKISDGQLILTNVETNDSEAEFDDEILFRDIPWYSTKAEVEHALENDGINLRYANYGDWIESTKEWHFNDGGICGVYFNVSVAGYKASNTHISYMYKIDENENIDHSEDNAEFYFAEYSFDSMDYADLQGIYDDLAAKLTSLYDEGVVEDKDEHTSVVTWCDSSGNKILLCIHDDGGDYGNVTLSYEASDTDARIEKMRAALEAEAMKSEAEDREANQDNVSGL